MDKVLNLKFKQVFPWVLVFGGIIGLIASSVLTIEKIQLAENPDYIPSCSISPIVACSPVIGSDQASAFGIPNPFLGLAGFAMVWAVGMMLLAGAQNLKKWFWWCFQAGSVFGMVFISWLMYQGLFNIAKLCLYCLVVWLVTIPIFWTTLSYNLRENNFDIKGGFGKFLRDNPGKLIAVSYLFLIILIFAAFPDYWYSLV